MIGKVTASEIETKTEINEFWTAKQRQMFPLHYTISFRGSFKAELPHYFIKRYLGIIPLLAKYFNNTEDLPVVFDPFSGRGTTALEANICGYPAFANDVNPLLERILYPLTHPVSISKIERRLTEIPFDSPRHEVFEENHLKFRPFYHEKTFSQLLNLRDYLQTHKKDVDRFIEVVALSRLHGHSKGFFSAYSFPQFSVRPGSQEKINLKHGNPEPRDVPKLILRKASSVLNGELGVYSRIREINHHNKICNDDVRDLKSIEDESVDLIVTSPPFMAQVDYIQDNWLKCWFLGIDQNTFKDNLVITASLETWRSFIKDAIVELERVLKKSGFIVIEVGDVNHNGNKINLDEHVHELGKNSSLELEGRLIHQQKFTKLSNCFRVTNNKKGVNTHRMIVFKKKRD